MPNVEHQFASISVNGKKVSKCLKFKKCVVLEFVLPVAEYRCRSFFSPSVSSVIWLIYCEVTCFINAYIILQDLGAVFVFCNTHGPANSQYPASSVCFFYIKRLVQVSHLPNHQKPHVCARELACPMLLVACAEYVLYCLYRTQTFFTPWCCCCELPREARERPRELSRSRRPDGIHLSRAWRRMRRLLSSFLPFCPESGSAPGGAQSSECFK
ncbi:uncharacterized protein LOC120323474 [Pipra filicauda]|uniref:Uncharacterized protein LOC120323474 n=1 Tax=Pipra filicauda TaxID=649802 RepID=A0A7R5KPJ1_9PASS|nr:uncharacterized protein LOC120323474 [Pipra filicauda]